MWAGGHVPEIGVAEHDTEADGAMLAGMRRDAARRDARQSEDIAGSNLGIR